MGTKLEKDHSLGNTLPLNPSRAHGPPSAEEGRASEFRALT